MRKSRVVAFTALAATAALVISACSGTPGQAGGSTTAAPAESSGSEATGSESAGSGSDITASPAAAEVGKVGGSGCGIPHGPYDEPATKGGDVRVAWNDPLLSFNNNTTHANATANTNVMYFTNPGVQLLRPGPEPHQQ